MFFWSILIFTFYLNTLLYPSWAAIQSTSLDLIQYANDVSPSPKINIDLSVQSQHEARLRSFIEAGPNGDWNADLDPFVLRYEGFWLGRENPNRNMTPQDAIGTHWVQNKTQALEPRVSGWIGAGMHSQIGTGPFHYTVAYSPIFLPSFGPSLSISESHATTGSRFATLPPSYVDLNGKLFPLRYKINISDLREILFQEQVYFSIEHRNFFGNFNISFWSAPSPDPSLDLNPKIQPGNDLNTEPNILIEAKPSFPRENFIAFAWTPSQSPVLQVTYELKHQLLTLSSRYNFSNSFSAGILHTFRTESKNLDDPTYTSHYDQGLIWGEWHSTFERFRISPSLRIEQHLIHAQQGSLIKPQLNYLTTNGLLVFLNLNILSGNDYSYFGTWKSLDSASIGVQLQW